MSLEFKGGAELRGDIARMADMLRSDAGGATTNRIPKPPHNRFSTR